MNCPACKNELAPTTVGGVTVDVCQNGCGGIWFDNLELRKVAALGAAKSEGLLAIERDATVGVSFTEKRRCPALR